jgi:hypothetical protein
MARRRRLRKIGRHQSQPRSAEIVREGLVAADVACEAFHQESVEGVSDPETTLRCYKRL